MSATGPDRISISITRLHPDARLPVYAHGPIEDAGMDLCALEGAELAPRGGRATVRTGLAIALPPGFEAQVRPRSGLARKFGITLPNAPGTIDPGYRGEIGVIMMNLGDEPFRIEPGDRIAQMVVARYTAVEWREAESLEDSARGTAGFGSTGR